MKPLDSSKEIWKSRLTDLFFVLLWDFSVDFILYLLRLIIFICGVCKGFHLTTFTHCTLLTFRISLSRSCGFSSCHCVCICSVRRTCLTARRAAGVCITYPVFMFPCLAFPSRVSLHLLTLFTCRHSRISLSSLLWLPYSILSVFTIVFLPCVISLLLSSHWRLCFHHSPPSGTILFTEDFTSCVVTSTEVLCRPTAGHPFSRPERFVRLSIPPVVDNYIRLSGGCDSLGLKTNYGLCFCQSTLWD